MAKDVPTDDTQPPRCPGKSGQRCASFVRADSPHELCRKCRACDIKHPCKLCEDKSPSYWRALDKRGKRSKSKSQTPVSSDSTNKKSTTKKSRESTAKTVGEDNAESVSIRTVNVPQQGLSSVADSDNNPPHCTCTVRGFPPDSRLLGDGSISYS
jgi:hypothetical protein